MSALDVLEQLLADANACIECGKAHTLREMPDRGGLYTWADPGDGHAYRRPPVDIEWLAGWVARSRRSAGTS